MYNIRQQNELFDQGFGDIRQIMCRFLVSMVVLFFNVTSNSTLLTRNIKAQTLIISSNHSKIVISKYEENRQ